MLAQSPVACHRPKLSLQTECLPTTFGKSTTGLSVNLAVDSTSPTATNTFRNAYHHHSRPSASRSAHFSRHNTCTDIKTPDDHHYHHHVPYSFSREVRSILRNSPFRTALADVDSRPKLNLPSKKRVAYQTPLNEEISTVTFTARHSDLLDDFQTDPTVPALPRLHCTQPPPPHGIPFMRPAAPTTPIASSHKVSPREWRWTLGPIRDGCVLLNSRGDDDDNMISPTCIDRNHANNDDYDYDYNENNENENTTDENANRHDIDIDDASDDESLFNSSAASDRSSPNSSINTTPDLTPLHTPTSPASCTTTNDIVFEKTPAVPTLAPPPHNHRIRRTTDAVQPQTKKKKTAAPVPPLLRVPTPATLRPT